MCRRVQVRLRPHSPAASSIEPAILFLQSSWSRLALRLRIVVSPQPGPLHQHSAGQALSPDTSDKSFRGQADTLVVSGWAAPVLPPALAASFPSASLPEMAAAPSAESRALLPSRIHPLAGRSVSGLPTPALGACSWVSPTLHRSPTTRSPAYGPIRSRSAWAFGTRLHLGTSSLSSQSSKFRL